MKPIARSLVLAAVVAAVAAVPGCLPPRALNPFYTAADLVLDHRLVGTFDDEDEPFRIRVRLRAPAGADSVYTLEDPDPESTAVPLAGHLFRLGGSLWLDIASSRRLEGDDDWLFAPLHWVCRVDFPEDGLELGCLEEQWLRERIAAGTAEPMVVLADDEIILTGTTEELQAFLLRHRDDPAAFPAERLQRVEGTAEPLR